MLSGNQLQSIGGLIAKYEEQSRARRKRLQEADVRSGFIDPLFAFLGWAMDQWDDVERETTGIEGKRPDYIFKIAGVPRFFLEAKPFRDDIYDQEETRKAITKAYNKGVPWVGIINFERFVLYDAQEELTEAQPRRVLDLGYLDYLDTQAEAGIHLLTREAVQSHGLEEFAQRIGARRRVVPIEKRLYDSMRGWREDLFNALFQVKQWKTEEEFRQGDEAIQRLIDRLIFLRNCEDRDIGGTDLRGLRNRIRSRDRGVRVTESLLRLFARAASTYDSEIFQTDAVIDVLLRGTGTVLDATLADIVEGLYSVPRSYSEYDFSQMEPDVLGEVYEQYLGYVPQRVRKLAVQQPLPGMPAEEITIEAKRQRRKERGIYYTPRWVVQYIVQQTLGRFLQENRDRPDAIDNLTILDPAAGSGSFLIRAYETLLEHHAEQMGGDIGHLDTHTRERILRRNIFGVDLDPQAVEIARLNLLIRMVRQQELLPELKDNIEHGNSLIEGDKAALHPYFGDAWEEKQPFNWGQRFPDVTERGGFDIIIGNPPYVRIQTLPHDEVVYYNEKYEAATGNYDIYCLFVERGLKLLRPGGYLGFIIPNKFMQTAYGKGLRSLLADAKAVCKIVDFGDAQIFESGTNYTCLLFLRKRENKALVYTSAREAVSQPVHTPSGLELEKGAFEVPTTLLGPRQWVFLTGVQGKLKTKLDEIPTRLSGISESIFQGLKTSADKVYIMQLLASGDDRVRVLSRSRAKEYALEPALLKPLIKGEEMRRYHIGEPDKVVLFPYSDGRLIEPRGLKRQYPKTWAYLVDNRDELENREKGKMRHESWYAYIYPKNLDKFDLPKIITPDVAASARYSLDSQGLYYFSGGGAGGYGIVPGEGVAAEYVLALLNSRLLDWYLHQISSPFRGGYHSYESRFIGQLPILIPQSGAQKKSQRSLVTLARRMLKLHQRLAKGVIADSERERTGREIDTTDREIDNLVYDLYGLTKKERALIESEASAK